VRGMMHKIMPHAQSPPMVYIQGELVFAADPQDARTAIIMAIKTTRDGNKAVQVFILHAKTIDFADENSQLPFRTVKEMKSWCGEMQLSSSSDLEVANPYSEFWPGDSLEDVSNDFEFTPDEINCFEQVMDPEIWFDVPNQTNVRAMSIALRTVPADVPEEESFGKFYPYHDLVIMSDYNDSSLATIFGVRDTPEGKRMAVYKVLARGFDFDLSGEYLPFCTIDDLEAWAEAGAADE